MHITKYLHSCLLIEENSKTVIIDPGNFTYEEQVLDTSNLTNLDYILITHEHPDHMHLSFIKKLIKHFPEVKIISNPSIESILSTESIPVHTDLSQLPADVGIQFEEVAHEKIFDKPAPQNLLFEVFSKLAHPGDSLSFETNMEILALPLLGPSWMITQAAEKAVALKPKYVIPIHDYHWKDTLRKEFYKRLENFFKQHEIDFKPLETGEIIEI